MIVVILVLGSLLMISRHPIGSNKHLGDDKETNKSWYSDSPYLGGIEPLSSPKAPDQNRTNHPYNFQPQPTSNDPTPPSLDNYLSQVLDMSKLYDQQSPLGRAYHWIAYQDGMKYDSNYVMIVQRFVLAAFYFATGGGRTKTSWTKCSAVPPNLVLDDKTRSIRCVTDKGHEDDGIICAYTNSFRECEESDEVDYTPEPTYRKRRWLSDVVECDWYGITCNPNGHVIGLSLPQNGLNGTLLAELDFLSELKVLNLGGNQLIGTLPEWNGLSLVEHVLLFGMNLTGQIPSTWQSWSHLQTLDLSYNKFSGLLPFPGNWIQLYLLDLTSNNLEISISAEVGRVSSLTFLSLSGNSIGTTLPEVLWSLGSLQTLDLSECGMQGSIPDDIGRLINLVELELHQNSLSGTIPESLWSLTNLHALQLGPNNLSGSLSRNIGSLQKLKFFSIAGSGLTARIPASLGDLMMLEELQLQQNAFERKLPDSICSIPTLVQLMADCDGSESVECSCCTLCCNKKRGTCDIPK